MVDDQLAEQQVTDHFSRSAEQLVAEELSPMSDTKGKQVSVSWEIQREEVRLGEGARESSLECRKHKTKAEKDITLEILRQNFACSLKDAAKTIGVCPTTLKRICRQYGISRWPSRKIKKVGHSFRKLQVVMDSVEGVQGSLHLTSFYSSFPQLQSSSSSSSFFPKSLPSSSGSQSSSGSSTCCSSEETQVGGEEEQRPLRVTTSVLPPLPSTTTPRKVKAMFGDSKMRMRLQPNWRLTDLRREIIKQYGMGDELRSNLSLKYLDDDQEWVLLTCDADFEECIQVYKSSLKETIIISVHHSSSFHS